MSAQLIAGFWRRNRLQGLFASWLLAATVAATLAGCVTNPVTGESELMLISAAQELEIGRQQYSPGRQMSGGDYVVDPALTEYVAGVGRRLAAVSDRDLPYEFKVVNDSTPNAWALPGGKIAVHRGLLTELNSEAELAAVLGHEVVHAAAKHSAKSITRGMLLQGAMVATAVASQGEEYGSLLMTGTGLAAQLVNQKYGRDAERESDLYGMQYMSKAGYDPKAAIDLQETFVRLSEGRDTSWLAGMFASHPPSQERVENNRSTAQTLDPGGEYGRDRYQAAIAGLIRTKPAYEAHDEGRKALADGDLASALSAAEKALSIEPRETIFHALRGDVRFTQERYSDSLINFNRAVDRSPGYFYPLMRRGLVLQKLDRDTEAAKDLEASIAILPTAQATNALGQIRLAQGDRDAAVKLFQSAAGSNSPAGAQAQDSLLRIDLPQNPQRYLKIRLGTDSRGMLIAEVANPSSADIGVEQLVIEYLQDDRQVRQYKVPLSLRVPAGSAARTRTGLGPLQNQAGLQRFRAAVTQARLIE